MTNRPFRVEFSMAAPVQMDYMPVHLDGLLAWALLQEKLAEFTSGILSAPPNPDDPNCSIYSELPLNKKDSVYCASMVLPQERLGGSCRFYTRKNDAEALAVIGLDDAITGQGVVKNQALTKKITSQRGELKNYIMYEQLTHTPLMLAYGVGDIDRVKDLLQKHVHGLGKNRAKGFGSVSHIDVAEDADGADHWKIRALTQKQEGYIPMVTPVLPPYWNKSRARIAYVPADVL